MFDSIAPEQIRQALRRPCRVTVDLIERPETAASSAYQARVLQGLQMMRNRGLAQFQMSNDVTGADWSRLLG